MAAPARKSTDLLLVMACLTATLAVGLAHKSPCAAGQWADGRQYEQLCYSDIVPLYGTEQLQENRLPYLDECTPVEGQNCDEYPLLTMYAMRVAAYPVSTFAGFFFVNAALLGVAALLTALFLYLLVGVRALYFALAPTVLIYSFLNWDLYAVVAATAGTWAFLRRRDVLSGVLLGIGAATKLYPALLVVPFVLERARKSDWLQSGVVAAATAGTWALLNLPFALAAREPWAHFFRFNSERAPDFDSMWFMACRHFSGLPFCGNTRLVNVLSLVALAGIAVIVYAAKARREPDFARWTFGFPLLIAFLLSNKVYSPQYSLWLIPWFALAFRNPWPLVVFSFADMAVFITRFQWFGELAGLGGVSFAVFETAILLRAVVLIGLLVVYVRQQLGDPLESAIPATKTRPATAGAA